MHGSDLDTVTAAAAEFVPQDVALKFLPADADFCVCRCSHGVQLCQRGDFVIDVEKLQTASSSFERYSSAMTYVLI